MARDLVWMDANLGHLQAADQPCPARISNGPAGVGAFEVQPSGGVGGDECGFVGVDSCRMM
jgi:hypothetical protein